MGRGLHSALIVAPLAGCGESPAPPPAPVGQIDEGDGIDAELERLQALGYAAWDEGADPGRSGVTVHDRERVQIGLNLYTNDVDEAYLVDLDGERVHTWRLPGKRNWQLAEPLPDGTLLAICVEQSLTRLDRDSNVLWDVPLRVDHDVARLDDGSLLVQVIDPPREHRRRQVVFDAIARVAADGQVLDPRWWSSFDALDALQRHHGVTGLDRAPSEKRAAALAETVFDYHHLNTIEVLPDTPLGRRDGRFRAGNVLICLRNVDLVAVLDQATRAVVWGWGPGELDAPHMPTMLADGRILIFDNGWDRGWSRILELDPESGEIVWSHASEPREAFFTRERGGNQRLPNGNTLICESERGRVFEVTADGGTVWEFWNPEIEDGKRKRIYRFHRLGADVAEALLGR